MASATKPERVKRRPQHPSVDPEPVTIRRGEPAPGLLREIEGFEPPRAEVPTNRPVAWHIVFRQSRDEAVIYFRTGF
jgi:hypothetical protein